MRRFTCFLLVLQTDVLITGSDQALKNGWENFFCSTIKFLLLTLALTYNFCFIYLRKVRQKLIKCRNVLVELGDTSLTTDFCLLLTRVFENGQ